MVDISWSAVLEGVDEALVFFRDQGVKPTLRTLFYNLYSKGLMPNTKTAYQGLSKHLVKARKEGRYEWDFMEDKTRVAYGGLDDSKWDEDVIEDFEENLTGKLDRFSLDMILRATFDYMRPNIYASRWADQPQVCEIWIEKEALASTINNWVEELGITVRVNRGYSSWTFIYNNAEALKGILDRHELVTIYYLGDLDPSGVDIERFLREALEYFELDPETVKLVRLGITGDQVEKYNLPPRPEDAETLAKLERDPRKASYMESYIVELDALVAYVPSDFRSLVKEAINQVWDQDLHEDLKEEARDLHAKANKLLEETKYKAKEKLRTILNGEK